jgi:four helix bundle protein
LPIEDWGLAISGKNMGGIVCASSNRVGSQAEELKARTSRFAQDVVGLIRELPNSLEARTLGSQLLSSATSVAANYRSACRARSHSEFIAKIGIVVEEADESLFWLELLIKTVMIPASRVEALRSEADQLTAIFTASHKTACARRSRK